MLSLTNILLVIPFNSLIMDHCFEIYQRHPYNSNAYETLNKTLDQIRSLELKSKNMIDKMIYDAMHEDLSQPRTDAVHSMNEFLPKGERPLNQQENEYLTKRLLKENEKLTEWPEVNVG